MIYFAIVLFAMYWILSWTHRCIMAFIDVPFSRKLQAKEQRKKTNLKKGLALFLFWAIITSPGFWLLYQTIFSGGCL